jgi:hypothetical protein
MYQLVIIKGLAIYAHSGLVAAIRYIHVEMGMTFDESVDVLALYDNATAELNSLDFKHLSNDD